MKQKKKIYYHKFIVVIRFLMKLILVEQKIVRKVIELPDFLINKLVYIIEKHTTIYLIVPFIYCEIIIIIFSTVSFIEKIIACCQVLIICTLFFTSHKLFDNYSSNKLYMPQGAKIMFVVSQFYNLILWILVLLSLFLMFIDLIQQAPNFQLRHSMQTNNYFSNEIVKYVKELAFPMVGIEITLITTMEINQKNK